MLIGSLILAFLMQAAPAPVPARVVVGLKDGQQLVVEDPEFTGFIQGRSGDAVVAYRQQHVHSRIPTRAVAKIEFGEYKKGKPFAMTMTLRNGQVLNVVSESQDFVMLKGRTDRGVVTIKHPDPISTPAKLTTKKPNREKDLTIQYLEFPER